MVADAKSDLPMLEAIKSKDPEQWRKPLDEIIEGWAGDLGPLMLG